jgi:hypothetical protein
MAPIKSFIAMLQFLCFLLVLPFTTALKFDLFAQPGHSSKNERCIRNFVNRDTLVVVTATVGGSKGDGQVVNMHVCSPEPAEMQRHATPLVDTEWRRSRTQ